MLNSVVYILPGVFENVPYKNAVNGSLWTLPYELKMYMGVAFFGFISLFKHKILFNIIYFIILILYLFLPKDC
jgi:hypothetical protein